MQTMTSTSAETKVTASRPICQYALGNTDAEHERLIRQAARLAPLTERLFREAGIGAGQRVLDLGSGVGDVAMLAARLVGPLGEVVGVERDPRSIARARARVDEAGLHNVSFIQSDVEQIASDEPFDAAVGRLILMYVPNPAAVLCSTSRMVRPGGILAFQEPTWAPALAIAAGRPLWSAALSVSRDTFQRTGAHPELGLALHRMFQEAGLPAPTMSLELKIEADREFIRYFCDSLSSLRPQIERLHVSVEGLGDFRDLPMRLQSELERVGAVVGLPGIVSAWSRKPEHL
jgi:ubiquinone/menaquinone biosynthesis C-methylase UbiE